MFHAKGCSQCTGGYKGRVGIYQVMPCTEAIGRIIMEGGNAIQIADQARVHGIPESEVLAKVMLTESPVKRLV